MSYPISEGVPEITTDHFDVSSEEFDYPEVSSKENVTEYFTMTHRESELVKTHKQEEPEFVSVYSVESESNDSFDTEMIPPLMIDLDVNEVQKMSK